MKNNSQLINQDSGNVEWYTPWAIIECARALMGSIDLDPFSCHEANYRPEGIVALTYFSNNGLIPDWYGNVWMNHPFGKEMNKIAIEKILYEHKKGVMVQACCITFASTSERWFKPLLEYPQFFFTGRTNYLDGATMQPVKGVTKGSVITFFPPRGMTYQDAVSKLHNAFITSFEGVAK